jgi:hypothetical protein
MNYGILWDFDAFIDIVCSCLARCDGDYLLVRSYEKVTWWIYTEDFTADIVEIGHLLNLLVSRWFMRIIFPAEDGVDFLTKTSLDFGMF